VRPDLGASRRYTLSHVQVRGPSPDRDRHAHRHGWLVDEHRCRRDDRRHSGVGYLILQAGNYLRTSLVFCGIISIGIMGLLLDACLRLLLRWADPAAVNGASGRD